MKDLILLDVVMEDSSYGMAVPKSRRSKAKGRTRLSNWKKKGEKASRLALNSAKTFFQKEKKEAALTLMKDKNKSKETTDSVE